MTTATHGTTQESDALERELGARVFGYSDLSSPQTAATLGGTVLNFIRAFVLMVNAIFSRRRARDHQQLLASPELMALIDERVQALLAARPAESSPVIVEHHYFRVYFRYVWAWVFGVIGALGGAYIGQKLAFNVGHFIIANDTVTLYRFMLALGVTAFGASIGGCVGRFIDRIRNRYTMQAIDGPVK